MFAPVHGWLRRSPPPQLGACGSRLPQRFSLPLRECIPPGHSRFGPSHPKRHLAVSLTHSISRKPQVNGLFEECDFWVQSVNAEDRLAAAVAQHHREALAQSSDVRDCPAHLNSPYQLWGKMEE